jgi:hypothetical protein
MKQVEKGIIQIADISGYTAFLNESELEHAQDTLQSLLEVLIENTHGDQLCHGRQLLK